MHEFSAIENIGDIPNIAKKFARYIGTTKSLLKQSFTIRGGHQIQKCVLGII